jgi:antitoxin MazE
MEDEMLATIRRLGNSQGVLIPKPLLQQVGLVDQAEMLVEGDALVLRRPKAAPRSDWATASQKLAVLEDDSLVLPEFGNRGDRDLRW